MPKKNVPPIDGRIHDWVGRSVVLERADQIRCEHRLHGERLAVKFEPLSLNEGCEWHAAEGIVRVFLLVDVRADTIIGVTYAAEYCTCGGHQVGGRAPAWIFPSNPVDEVEPEALPPLLRKRINCVLGMIAGEPDTLDAYTKWHDETENGWSQERPLSNNKSW